LNVTAASSNAALAPDTNIFLGGSGASRTVFVTPVTDQTGTVTVTLTVSDGQKTASTSFTVTVGGNTAPTISTIANQTITPGTRVGPLSFTVGDAETAPASLTVTPSLSNSDVVAITGVVLGGTGADRVITLTPKAGAIGTVTVTLRVSDGELNTTTSFTITSQAGAAVTLVKDWNNDQRSDLLLQNVVDGTLGVWFLDGTTLLSAALLNPDNVGDTGWRIVATGDLDGDKNLDIVFQHTDGTLAAWLMQGTRLRSAAFISPQNPGDPAWRVRGSADVNNDGKIDLLFQHTDGTLAVWLMNGTSLASASLLNPANPGDANWKLSGSGDFNKDGNADLLFQHTNGTLAAWIMSGVNLTQGSLLNPGNPGDAMWKAVGTVDFNRDGQSDVIFQHAGDNQLAAWIMDGLNLSEGRLMTFPGDAWKVAAP
jgi:hypothetical protein